jgi:hypothetical protein
MLISHEIFTILYVFTSLYTESNSSYIIVIIIIIIIIVVVVVPAHERQNALDSTFNLTYFKHCELRKKHALESIDKTNTTYLKGERTSEIYELATHLKHKENNSNQ